MVIYTRWYRVRIQLAAYDDVLHYTPDTALAYGSTSIIPLPFGEPSFYYKKMMMRYWLLILCCCWMSVEMDAQRSKRRGAHKKGQELEIFKSICCYFVNDYPLTKASQYLYRAEADTLAQRYMRRLYPDALIHNEELTNAVYQHLIAIRLSDEPALAPLNDLAIHETIPATKGITTHLYLDYDLAMQCGFLQYEIRGPDGVQVWRVTLDVCPVNYTVKALYQDPISPHYLLPQRMRSAAELRSN